jgi:hypothetical protein
MWHVREGFVSRGRRAKRRTQKAVDVQLAVDALEHAVAHNMDTATFVLGDLDFEPLFFSLNRFGVIVSVYYFEGTASEELLEAADARSPIVFSMLNDLIAPTFSKVHPIPAFVVNTAAPEQVCFGKGEWRGREVSLYKDTAVPSVTIWVEPGANGEMSHQVDYRADDEAKAGLAFEMQFGGQSVGNY